MYSVTSSYRVFPRNEMRSIVIVMDEKREREKGERVYIGRNFKLAQDGRPRRHRVETFRPRQLNSSQSRTRRERAIVREDARRRRPIRREMTKSSTSSKPCAELNGTFRAIFF